MPRSEEHHAFLEPFDNIQDLRNGVLCAALLVDLGPRFECCYNFLSTQLPLDCHLAPFQLQ